jgi:hypothetical protein
MKPITHLTQVYGAFALCSVQVDSQFGVRLGPPAVRNQEATLLADAECAALHAESSLSSQLT